MSDFLLYFFWWKLPLPLKIDGQWNWKAIGPFWLGIVNIVPLILVMSSSGGLYDLFTGKYNMAGFPYE